MTTEAKDKTDNPSENERIERMKVAIEELISWLPKEEWAPPEVRGAILRAKDAMSDAPISKPHPKRDPRWPFNPIKI